MPILVGCVIFHRTLSASTVTDLAPLAGLDFYILITEQLTGGGRNAMLKPADKNDILRVYDISLQSGKSSTGSAMHLAFATGSEYAGQSFTLVHQKADGSFEYFFAEADPKGNVKFGPLYELSPFMLVKGTLVHTPEYQVTEPPKTGDRAFCRGLFPFLSARHVLPFS